MCAAYRDNVWQEGMRSGEESSLQRRKEGLERSKEEMKKRLTKILSQAGFTEDEIGKIIKQKIVSKLNLQVQLIEDNTETWYGVEVLNVERNSFTLVGKKRNYGYGAIKASRKIAV